MYITVRAISLYHIEWLCTHCYCFLSDREAHDLLTYFKRKDTFQGHVLHRRHSHGRQLCHSFCNLLKRVLFYKIK